MKTFTVLTATLTLFSNLALAHPPNFAPNHATLQKRCPPFDPAGVKNIGNGAGTQFIGGQCLSGADCASGCCANPCGICSGVGAQTQAGKTGCGFGGGAATSGNSNDNAAGSGDANAGVDDGDNSASDNSHNNANNNANPNDDVGSNDNNSGGNTGSNDSKNNNVEDNAGNGGSGSCNNSNNA